MMQPIGSYWHLDTRPEEHASMSSGGWEGRLKLAARAIHERLGRDGMQCVVHGNVKDANMLFLDGCGGDDDNGDGGGAREARVGMYDFQYCGRAPPSVGMRPHPCPPSLFAECRIFGYFSRTL
jgi:prepilin-type processing-associated H-X9-DG protein